MQKITLDITTSAEEHGIGQYKILGRTFAVLPSRAKMSVEVINHIREDIEHGVFTYITLEQIMDRASGEAFETLREYVLFNYEEIYRDIHGISETFVITVNATSIKVYEDE